MIRVNLLAVKRKKKAKPLPSFVISTVLVTVVACCVMAYVAFYFNSKLQAAKTRFAANNAKIAELKEKIKEVDSYEKLNKTINDKNKLIEQLRRNQNIPVMLLDELSRRLPKGVWINSLAVSSTGGNLDGFGFTNSDVVAFVDNLKDSKVLVDIYLQESMQAEVDKIPLYRFRLTFKVAA
jgi:Tfp pilus assembly protein PilN